jgi:hypothetical protein
MNPALFDTTAHLPARRSFSSADVRSMVEAGVLAENERIELIRGDLLVMAPKCYAHELVRHALMREFLTVCDGVTAVGVAMTTEFSR